MLQKGLIQVYTTPGEETNFAPLGLCLRASGHNLRSLITCFSAHELMEGCHAGPKCLEPLLVINHPITSTISPTVTTASVCQAAYKEAVSAVVEARYDLVVLNGIHFLLENKLVDIEHILELCRKKPPAVELVFAGSRLPQALIEIADLVTQMIVTHNPDKIGRRKSGQTHKPVEIITGNGKGKTTYCLGKAMLASCTGVPSFVLQVIKSPKAYGEVMAIERLPNLTIKTMGKGFIGSAKKSFEKVHMEAARRAWEVWLREIYSMHYGLLVLDEINVATHYGLIRPERVEEMLFLKPPSLHILLSGRNAHPDVLKMASTVIEMREIKHPFKKGIKARKGIEF